METQDRVIVALGLGHLISMSLSRQGHQEKQPLSGNVRMVTMPVDSLLTSRPISLISGHHLMVSGICPHFMAVEDVFQFLSAFGDQFVMFIWRGLHDHRFHLCQTTSDQALNDADVNGVPKR